MVWISSPSKLKTHDDILNFFHNVFNIFLSFVKLFIISQNFSSVSSSKAKQTCSKNKLNHEKYQHSIPCDLQRFLYNFLYKNKTATNSLTTKKNLYFYSRYFYKEINCINFYCTTFYKFQWCLKDLLKIIIFSWNKLLEGKIVKKNFLLKIMDKK